MNPKYKIKEIEYYIVLEDGRRMKCEPFNLNSLEKCVISEDVVGGFGNPIKIDSELLSDKTTEDIIKHYDKLEEESNDKTT